MYAYVFFHRFAKVFATVALKIGLAHQRCPQSCAIVQTFWRVIWCVPECYITQVNQTSSEMLKCRNAGLQALFMIVEAVWVDRDFFEDGSRRVRPLLGDGRWEMED